MNHHEKPLIGQQDFQLTMSASPHLRTPIQAKDIMRDVCLALLPAILGSIYIFGLRVLPYYLISLFFALGSDWLWQKFVKKKAYYFDYSPMVTGLLFAMSLPGDAPLWFAAFGPAFAIIVAKEMFGGIGKNFLNPAIAGRGVLRVVFVAEMTSNIWPRANIPEMGVLDGYTGATPLLVLKNHEFLSNEQLLASFLGTVGGKIGETSALLLLIGAVYLFWKRIINWRIPFTLLATIAVIAFVFGGPAGLFSGDYRVVIGHLLGGASILGAFYMATDYSSSPSAPKAQILFAIGCGIITMLFRFYSSYSEGFTFALLIMNCTVPLFDRYMRPRVLGEKT